MNKKNIMNILNSSNHYLVTYNDIEKEVDANFVKNLRKKLGMSQNVFASVLGVTKKTIEKWEQGVNPVKGCSARLLFLINTDDTLIKQIYNFEFVKNDSTKFIVPSSDNSNVVFSNKYAICSLGSNQQELNQNENPFIYKDKNSNFGLCC